MRRGRGLGCLHSASELFAFPQTLDWKVLGVGVGTSSLAVFNSQSRASSRVYGSFKTSGTSGMKANTLGNRKIIHRPHQGSEGVTGAGVCHLGAAGELPENPQGREGLPITPLQALGLLAGSTHWGLG